MELKMELEMEMEAGVAENRIGRGKSRVRGRWTTLHEQSDGEAYLM